MAKRADSNHTTNGEVWGRRADPSHRDHQFEKNLSTNTENRRLRSKLHEYDPDSLDMRPFISSIHSRNISRTIPRDSTVPHQSISSHPSPLPPRLEFGKLTYLDELHEEGAHSAIRVYPDAHFDASFPLCAVADGHHFPGHALLFLG